MMEEEPLLRKTKASEGTAGTVAAACMIACIGFGFQVSFLSISAIAPLLKEQHHMDSRDIALLYSAYHLPNFVMVFIGGVWADRVGLKLACLVFSFLALLGTTVTAFASSLHVMLLGRFIFGVGAESVCVCQMAFCARWFRRPKGILTIATTFALCDTLTRIAGIFTFNAVAALGQQQLNYAWICVEVCAISSCLCTLGLVSLDKKATADGLLQVDPVDSAPVQNQKASAWNHVCSLPFIFWILVGICVCTYATLISFVDFAVDYMYERYEMPVQTASRLTSVITIVCLVSTPFAGFFIDHIGNRPLITWTGTLLLFSSFATLLYTSLHPLFTFVQLGTALTLVSASLWSSIPIVVPQHHLNMSLGILTCLQNMALFAVPIVIGELHDIHGRYRPGIRVLLGLSLTAALLSTFLVLWPSQGHCSDRERLEKATYTVERESVTRRHSLVEA